LRYIETGASMYRIVSIVKLRESGHDLSIRRFVIDDKGLHLIDGSVGNASMLSVRGTIAPVLPTLDSGPRT
jgi:circadian clock protein KaiC